MSGERFMQFIQERKGPDEDANDIVTMIDLLATQRARINNRYVLDDDYDFAAAVICIIFPIKPPEYEDEIQTVRREYEGIYTDARLQIKFRRLLSNNLLRAESAQDAIRLGVNRLFLREMEAGR